MTWACAPAPGNRPEPRAPVTAAPAGNTAASSTAAAAAAAAAAGGLDPVEAQIAAHVEAHTDEAVALLERLVNINSGTMNADGVREVGTIFAGAFETLGFTTRWIPMTQVNRSGHLFAERRGTAGKRVLLIGHLDTVFEKDSPFQRFERISETLVKGPGTVDMKGGDLVILYALKALHSIGALDNTSITVAFTGDEEETGDPLSETRKHLIEAAKQSDVALGFEAGVGGFNTATIARRGFTGWVLEVRGKRGHSSRVFSPTYGAGALYETARILNSFYERLRGEEYLTVNAGLVLGGTSTTYDSEQDRGNAFGKTNVIPQSATVVGDLRALTIEQRERAKQTMLAIIAETENLPQTSAELRFRDSYPPMAPTDGNKAVLATLDGVSRDLGLGPVEVIDPGRRGAADISFAAPHVASLAGLGVVGEGSHSTDETLDLRSLPIATKRAAVLIYRLTRPAAGTDAQRTPATPRPR